MEVIADNYETSVSVNTDARLTMPNFIALRQTVYDKSVTFLHPLLFWRPSK